MRRQFRDIKRIWTQPASPNTQGRRHAHHGAIKRCDPVAVAGGRAVVVGMLSGRKRSAPADGTSSPPVRRHLDVHGGGAWDNAKKYIETATSAQGQRATRRGHRRHRRRPYKDTAARP